MPRWCRTPEFVDCLGVTVIEREKRERERERERETTPADDG